MVNLLSVLHKAFQPSVKGLERISNKARWSHIILLFVVCFLVVLGFSVFHDTFGASSLIGQERNAIINADMLRAVVVPFIICILWIVQYLMIRLLHGKGSFLMHGWADLICVTPCVIAVTCIQYIPFYNIWIVLLNLLILLGILSMGVLNSWMMRTIHDIDWGIALFSTFIGFIVIPVVLSIIFILAFISGYVEIPPPS